MADSVSDLSPEEQQRFNALVLKAKKYAGEGKVQLALDLNLQAFKIYASEKLGKRIQKMKTYLAEYGDDSDEADGDSMVHMGNGFYLFQELYKQLYAHQREGVTWMWWLFQKRKGGILGDDMGLGKTIQVIAFLSGMFDSEKIKSVLIILPVAVITNWENEFQKWAPGISTEHFHSGSKRDRDRALMKVQRRGGVCMTSYGMMVNNADQLAEQNGREFIWDYVILDEGHKIKNPSNKCSKGIHSVPARNRLLLTGTPVQNNLKEMWALFDWTHQGFLLGTSRTFKMEYEMPITRAREKDASGNEQILGEQMAQSLQKIISPYFLRRTKAEVKISEARRKEKEEKKEDEEGKDEKGIAPSMPTMTHKNDFIVWVYLSEIQQKIYHDFLESDEVKELLNSKRSPLVSLTILKKICDHPRLLTNRQCLQLGITDDDSLDTMDEETGNQIAANRVMHIDNELLVRESGKMVFLIELLDNLKAEGHRALVFSQSRKVLDIIQKVMTDRGHRVARLDGTVRHLMERDEIIQRFKDNRSYSIFLLTTQVGGVGLTLTAADRVVICE
ncbi:hypothetical protein CAPTEDRAFT_138667 [Capitella teleta]|uniref:Helicase ATP-binding domain-containing protein n=1 Tax=Capitella teleta TaxID=283909 RepID=R7VJ99_CAPTE|nr:hypothetical protein CAPTEDRAFT_138667 [Capitella teleta]|eukprot:ELU16421.1 hypothetical protein CAPTEDRAFT_138667 [Capitella teleta]